jgi:replicative superfamily II helicase
MNRLLQGDVGSGKTVIAAMAALIAAENNKQTAFMAPTEVLARQHYKTFEKIFGLPAALLLGAKKGNEKKKILEKIASGKTKIIIGTHALIQKNVKFNNLALIVIDEQHRFGVNQRAGLVGRGQTQTNTQTNAENENKLLYQDLSYKIRGVIFDVRKNIGLGHKEIIYQKAVENELKKIDVTFEKEKTIDVIYGDQK